MHFVTAPKATHVQELSSYYNMTLASVEKLRYPCEFPNPHASQTKRSEADGSLYDYLKQTVSENRDGTKTVKEEENTRPDE